MTTAFLLSFYRSIILNPAYFRNHLRQATVFRCLERYSEAARYVCYNFCEDLLQVKLTLFSASGNSIRELSVSLIEHDFARIIIL